MITKLTSTLYTMRDLYRFLTEILCNILFIIHVDDSQKYEHYKNYQDVGERFIKAEPAMFENFHVFALF